MTAREDGLLAHTMINHERDPHCCGCYNVTWNNGDPMAVCNECGHKVELLVALAEQPAGAVGAGAAGQGDAVNVAENKARAMYVAWCDQQDIHCNRLPAWHELPSKRQGEWLDKVVEPDTGNPEADNLIGRLMHADPTFSDCTDAAALIRKMATATPPAASASVDAEGLRAFLQRCKVPRRDYQYIIKPAELDALIDSAGGAKCVDCRHCGGTGLIDENDDGQGTVCMDCAYNPGCCDTHDTPQPDGGDGAVHGPIGDDVRAALLFALWHHQGGSSGVGQPIRKMLGMHQHQHLSPEQSEIARAVQSSIASRPSAAAVVWTDEQCVEFMRFALRHTEYRRGTPGPSVTEIRQGAMRAAALATPRAEQEHVPGVMRCANCNFRLVRTNLYVADGTFGAGDNMTEPCPNGCGPLLPVTWEQEARECWERLESMATPRAEAAVPDADCHKLDTPEQVFFYEQDFYVLSNFSAFSLQWRGLRFDTSEAAYHYEKFPDRAAHIRVLIQQAPSAHVAFKIAEANKHLQRHNWDDVKLDVMRHILRAKAGQHEYVRRKLLATGNRELVEDSWRDDFWGWGPNHDGQNWLGRLWMEVRAELRAEQEKHNG